MSRTEVEDEVSGPVVHGCKLDIEGEPITDLRKLSITGDLRVSDSVGRHMTEPLKWQEVGANGMTAFR